MKFRLRRERKDSSPPPPAEELPPLVLPFPTELNKDITTFIKTASQQSPAEQRKTARELSGRLFRFKSDALKKGVPRDTKQPCWQPYNQAAANLNEHAVTFIAPICVALENCFSRIQTETDEREKYVLVLTCRYLILLLADGLNYTTFWALWEATNAGTRLNGDTITPRLKFLLHAFIKTPRAFGEVARLFNGITLAGESSKQEHPDALARGEVGLWYHNMWGAVTVLFKSLAKNSKPEIQRKRKKKRKKDEQAEHELEDQDPYMAWTSKIRKKIVELHSIKKDSLVSSTASCLAKVSATTSILKKELALAGGEIKRDDPRIPVLVSASTALNQQLFTLRTLDISYFPPPLQTEMANAEKLAEDCKVFQPLLSEEKYLAAATRLAKTGLIFGLSFWFYNRQSLKETGAPFIISLFTHINNTQPAHPESPELNPIPSSRASEADSGSKVELEVLQPTSATSAPASSTTSETVHETKTTALCRELLNAMSPIAHTKLTLFAALHQALATGNVEKAKESLSDENLNTLGEHRDGFRSFFGPSKKLTRSREAAEEIKKRLETHPALQQCRA